MVSKSAGYFGGVGVFWAIREEIIGRNGTVVGNLSKSCLVCPQILIFHPKRDSLFLVVLPTSSTFGYPAMASTWDESPVDHFNPILTKSSANLL